MAKAKINPEFTYKTRDGQEVTDIQANTEKSADKYPFKATVNGRTEYYTGQGYYYANKSIDGLDLIKQPVRKPKVAKEEPVQQVAESKESSEIKPHRHHDLIVAWAKNPKLIIQYKSHFTPFDWKYVEYPEWDTDYEYRIKPEEPKLLTIIGADGKARSYPEPWVMPLNFGQEYFVPATSLLRQFSESYTWGGDEFDSDFQVQGRVHLTQKAAEAHAKAMLGID